MTSFSDDFNRADGSPGANWVQVSGAWTIISQQLSSGTTGTTVVLRAATAMATSDNFSQVTIAATTSASQGVWCRGDSTLTSGYAVRNNGTNWALFSVVGGTFTSIGTYAAAAVAGDVVKIQAVGSTITAYINGISRISVTNTAVTTGTSVGIRSDVNSALKYDNYIAGDVVTGATLGIASSTETAQPLTGAKTATLVPATEADSAQALTGAKTAALTPAAEGDAAQTLTGSKAATLATAAETATAQPLTGAKSAALTPAAEQDTAQSIAGTKTAALAPAVEQDTAQALGGVKTGTLGTAAAAETALPLTGSKTATLGTAVEVDEARPLTEPSTTVPSPERTLTIPAEGRRLTVLAEGRRRTIPAEPRTHTIRR